MNCKNCIHEGVCWKQEELLGEREQEEEQECCEDVNLFMKLPCKVGDTVYELDIYADIVKCGECDYYDCGGYGDPPSCIKTIHGNRCAECIDIMERIATEQDIYWWLYAKKFGKTVFLTKEEAEKALADITNKNKLRVITKGSGNE